MPPCTTEEECRRCIITGNCSPPPPATDDGPLPSLQERREAALIHYLTEKLPEGKTAGALAYVAEDILALIDEAKKPVKEEGKGKLPEPLRDAHPDTGKKK
jgi:hypothetical protein